MNSCLCCETTRPNGCPSPYTLSPPPLLFCPDAPCCACRVLYLYLCISPRAYVGSDYGNSVRCALIIWQVPPKGGVQVWPRISRGVAWWSRLPSSLPLWGGSGSPSIRRVRPLNCGCPSSHASPTDEFRWSLYAPGPTLLSRWTQTLTSPNYL